MPTLIYGSVCSGVEAFGKYWASIGYQCRFHAEIASHPSAVLRYHYPETPNYEDFTKIQASEATRIDVLCGGTPCQDFSIAGLRAGVAGTKGNLTLEFLLLVKRLGVRWVVWENVPGTFSSVSHHAPHPSPPPPPLDMELDEQEVDTEQHYDSEESHAFQNFLAGLSELGYGIAYRTYDAQYFGIPQRRRRIFLVAYLGDWRPATAVLFESESLRRDIAPSRKQGQEVASTVSGGARKSDQGDGADNLIIPFDTAQITSKANRSRCEPGSPSHTVSASGHAPAIAYQCHGGSVGEMGVIRAGNGSTTGGVPFIASREIAQTLTSNYGKQPDNTDSALGPTLAIAYGISNQPTPKFKEELMPTLDAKETGGGRMEAVAIGSAVRRLTPLECERLMGYPDEFTKYGTKADGTVYEVADGPRYQMCGNGWATPVANWVAERIMLVEQLLKPTL